MIDNPKDVGGLEDFPTVKRSASWDADGDGVADWWDGPTGGDGHDVIKSYFNFMADPQVFVAPSSSVDIDLAALAAGYVEPGLKAFEVSGSTATYAYEGAGVEWLIVSVEDAEGSI